jgi:2-phosphoglycerate kinase
MDKTDYYNFDIEIPQGFIVFISGVPGTGKTTISYELLRAFNEFRIIEETDLIREVLRGYNDYIKDEFGDEIRFLFNKIEIYDHIKFLSFDEARQQCIHMRKSLEQIVIRQQRKGISSIINGVHIIPEILDRIVENKNVVFINLFVNSECAIHKRLRDRNPNKYSSNHMPLIYQTNVDLYQSTLRLAQKSKYIFNNIDVTILSVKETVNEVVECIKGRIHNQY